MGGNFAGLAALWELFAWQQTQNGGADLEIVLIDQREYSEYTPGILRLFCEPWHFFKLAQALPETKEDSGFRRICGTVTSLLEDDGEGRSENANGRETKKVLTYVPTDEKIDSSEANAAGAAANTKNLGYDYLILATGATYNYPISPAPPVASGSGPKTTTLIDRYHEWKKAHEKLRGAKRVLVLGGGAVGVELAAEILDRESDTALTLVDAQPALVSLFPPSVGAYAEEWLCRRGADLRLGESPRSWNDRSCTLADGTVLHADVVYVCFGNRPNSEMVATKGTPSSSPEAARKPASGGIFSLTRRRNVSVKDTLQLVVNDGDRGENTVGPWFACGDVSGPPTNDEKQAFQAEMQGKVAARNVIRLLESSSSCRHPQGPVLLRYPQDIATADRIPVVFVLSLGRYDGVLGFNHLCIPGPLAAIVKWVLEHTKVSHMRGNLLGKIIWKIGDAVVLFLGRTVLRSTASSSFSVPANTIPAAGVVSGRKRTAISTASSSLLTPHLVTQDVHQRNQHIHPLEEQLKLS